MNLRKRIEALELRRAAARSAAKCICYPHEACFHNEEERDKARAIPCPIHGLPRFHVSFTTLSIEQALAPADRHLCHCPPMLERQAEEEGRVLSSVELKIAQQQYAEWWEAMCKEVYGEAPAITSPPMLARQAEEEGRTLTPAERVIAKKDSQPRQSRTTCREKGPSQSRAELPKPYTLEWTALPWRLRHPE